jgi:hypothetical protein
MLRRRNTETERSHFHFVFIYALISKSIFQGSDYMPSGISVPLKCWLSARKTYKTFVPVLQLFADNHSAR